MARLCRPGRVTARLLLGALLPRVQRGGAAVRDPSLPSAVNFAVMHHNAAIAYDDVVTCPLW
jgi:hypothetical protein